MSSRACWRGLIMPVCLMIVKFWVPIFTWKLGFQNKIIIIKQIKLNNRINQQIILSIPINDPCQIYAENPSIHRSRVYLFCENEKENMRKIYFFHILIFWFERKYKKRNLFSVLIKNFFTYYFLTKNIKNDEKWEWYFTHFLFFLIKHS